MSLTLGRCDKLTQVNLSSRLKVDYTSAENPHLFYEEI